MKNKVSPEVSAQAMKIAKSRQKQGQTKEQTKLIAQGIEKGIAEYKKQQNKRLRELDKQRKQNSRQVNQTASNVIEEVLPEPKFNMLPWVLLGASWLGFISFIVFMYN